MNGFTPVQFGFMVLFCHSFGNRSERPRALQLLIKMLIRCRLKWEERSLLYRAFVFKNEKLTNQGSGTIYERVLLILSRIENTQNWR